MVMENIININEYNDLINESNIIRNEIEEIDKDIISSNNGIKVAGKNINGALIAAGASIATCIVTLALKTPILVSFISGGMAAVSFNWALTATSYINIEKKRILECDNKKMSLIDKQVELKKRILSIEKNRENNFRFKGTSKAIKTIILAQSAVLGAIGGFSLGAIADSFSNKTAAKNADKLASQLQEPKNVKTEEG